MNNFTVAIFTKDRSTYLLRQLSIFRDIFCDFKIIILDGSRVESNRLLNEKIADQFKSNYLYEPSFFGRMKLLSSVLDTEYVAYCSDDDIINPLYYLDAVNYLESNKEYTLASGKIRAFSHIPRYKYLVGLEINHLTNTYDIVLGDFVEKICRRDQAYQMGCSPTFYSVRRSTLHHLLASYIGGIETLAGMERLATVLSVLEGGIIAIDTFMGYRDYSSTTTRDENREHPENYLSPADIKTIEHVIENILIKNGRTKEFAAYAKSYAWPLPFRANTGKYIESRGGVKRFCNMIFNQCISTEPLMSSLRRHQKLIRNI